MKSIHPITELPKLAKRSPDSHKGSYGKVLLIAGSRGMSGAAILCGSAALRSGAGLVTVAVPEAIQNLVSAGNPCYTTCGFSWDSPGILNDLRGLTDEIDVVAIGPGLGRHPVVGNTLVNLLVQLECPVVLDADALNALASMPKSILNERKFPTVMTPHPGEFGKLVGRSIPEVMRDREQLCADLSRERDCVVVLKGHETIVTDGNRMYRNRSGNPGMATGGCGDVLTGVIAALIGQRLTAFDAAVLGVWLHGRAGDRAADHLTQPCLIASDLIDYLPEAFGEILT